MRLNGRARCDQCDESSKKDQPLRLKIGSQSLGEKSADHSPGQRGGADAAEGACGDRLRCIFKELRRLEPYGGKQRAEDRRYEDEER